MGFETLPEGLESGLQHGKTVVIDQQVATTQRAVSASSRVRCSVPERHIRPVAKRSPTLTLSKHPHRYQRPDIAVLRPTMRAQLCQPDLDAV